MTPAATPPRASQLAAALRGYLPQRLLRQNPMAISAGIFLLVIALDLPDAAATVHRHGVAALFATRSGTLTPFWMASFFMPATIVHHYWRQVRTPIAPAVPGLIAAELAAVLVALVVAMLVLAAPLVWLGAPVAGVAGLVALAMVTGGGAMTTTPTGDTPALRRLRLGVFVPMLIAGFFPAVLRRVVLSPWPVGAGLCIACAALIVAGLRLRPAWAAQQMQHQGSWQDAQNAGLAKLHARLPARPAPLQAAPRTGQDPAPPGIVPPGGAAVIVMLVVLQFLGLMALLPGVALVQGDSWHQALREQAPFAIGMAAAAALWPRTQWLLDRGAWPFLMVAGRYGSRLSFARAAFRAHGMATLWTAGATAAVGVPLAVGCGLCGWAQAPAVAFAIIALIQGGSYLCALPLLWREFGGKGLVVAGGTGACTLVMFTLAALLDHGGRSLWALAVAGAAGVFGLAMARIAPMRLAAMDWPIEEAVA